MPLASQSSPGTERRQSVARRMDAFARRRPVASVLIATTAWVALLVVFMGLASIGLGRLYGDAIVAVSGRLAVTARRLLLFSVPLGALGLWMVGRGRRHAASSGV